MEGFSLSEADVRLDKEHSLSPYEFPSDGFIKQNHEFKIEIPLKTGCNSCKFKFYSEEAQDILLIKTAEQTLLFLARPL